MQLACAKKGLVISPLVWEQRTLAAPPLPPPPRAAIAVAARTTLASALAAAALAALMSVCLPRSGRERN